MIPPFPFTLIEFGVECIFFSNFGLQKMSHVDWLSSKSRCLKSSEVEMCVLNAKLYCEEHTSSLFSSSVLFTFVNCTDLFLGGSTSCWTISCRAYCLLLSCRHRFLSSAPDIRAWCVLFVHNCGRLLFSSIQLFAVQIYYYFPVAKMQIPMTQVMSLSGSIACIY